LPCRIITKENIQEAKGGAAAGSSGTYASPTTGPTSRPAEASQQTASASH